MNSSESQDIAGEASAEAAIADLAADVARTAEIAEPQRPAAPPPPPLDLTAAAFFDVDNTLVHGSSLVHFARGLAARKYVTYGDLLRFGYAQAKFQLTGRESSDDVAAGRRKGLAFIEGRSTAELMAVGEEIYDEIIADKIWPGTLALAQMHIDAGQQVWLVTATPHERLRRWPSGWVSPARSGRSPNRWTACSPVVLSATSCTAPERRTP